MQSDGSESEMGLALNRYIGNSILPALIAHSNFYAEADQHAPLLDATLHTVYRLSKCKVGAPSKNKKMKTLFSKVYYFFYFCICIYQFCVYVTIRWFFNVCYLL